MPAFSLFLLLATLLIFSPAAHAGKFTTSAHGDINFGVKRKEMPEYGKGNCAHCHEQHASIQSTEPAPSGGPQRYSLFALNFDTSATGTYVISDNMCFYCHDGTALGQTSAFYNYDYSETFGCAPNGVGVSNILAAFNQDFYHDLKDISDFALPNNGKTPAFSFGRTRNPCGVCHNPHLAKRNKSDTRNTALSAISLPTNDSNLYGVTQTMDDYSLSDEYVSPKCSSYREPNDSTTAAAQIGQETPDYPGLCQDCHNADNYDGSPTGTGIMSTRLGRYLKKIVWDGGDKHGGNSDFDGGDGALGIKFPYNDSVDVPYTGPGLILSCLDCHEPHGSNNVFLLRRRVNGFSVGNGTIASCDSMQWGYLCTACHTGGDSSTPPSWDSYTWDDPPAAFIAHGIHHDTADAVDAPGQGGGWSCSSCHPASQYPLNAGDTLNCNLCHFHGASISNNDSTDTRKTF